MHRHCDMNYEDSQGFLDPESLEYDQKYATQVRHGFIRKVFGILLSQILLTTIIGALFTLPEQWRYWVTLNSTPLMIVGGIASIIPLLALLCIPGVAEKHPINFGLLATFTLGESLLLGSTCAKVAVVYGVSTVLQAFIITSLLSCGLVLFSFQTKYDFTSWASAMFFALLGLCGLGLVRLFFPSSPFMDAVFATIGALIFCVYIIIDVQMVIGRQGKMKVSPDQYIYVALQLYLDFVNLFVEILRLVTASRQMQDGN